MKLNSITLTFGFIISCICLLSGCDEEQSRNQNYNSDWFNQAPPTLLQANGSPAARTNMLTNNQPIINEPRNNLKPKINFKAFTHNFGQISPNSTYTCEFTFTNTGNTDLVISDVESSCSCTIPTLEKKVYAPGESGKIVAKYNEIQTGQTVKHLYVHTNDPINPKIELSVQANVVTPVVYEPRTIDLSLIAPNGDCPPITVKSLDGQPFSITGFQSVGDCIKIDYNPNVKAKEFVVQPKVDVKLVERIGDGQFNINISHPKCNVVSGTFHAKPRFAISPRTLTVNNANPNKTVRKKINIISNYNENFNISPTSGNGIIDIVSLEPTNAGYELTVDIKPPQANNNTRMFSDNLKLDIKGIDVINVQCNGYYPGTSLIEEEKECKVCGAKRLNDDGTITMAPKNH